jgi:hypothetical protein
MIRRRRKDKIKMDNIPIKNPIFSPRRRLHRFYEPEAIIPQFHYSMIEAKFQTSKIPYIFNNL